MYNGIGLATTRGSGTNGYVQRNFAVLRGKRDKINYKTDEDIRRLDAAGNKNANQEILEHERKRKLESKCVELEDFMDNQGKYSKEQIDLRVSEYRRKLMDEFGTIKFIDQDEFGRPLARDTHQIAQAKQDKNEKLRLAFGISQYFVEGTSLDPNRKEKEKAAAQVNKVKSYPILGSDSESPKPDVGKKRIKKAVNKCDGGKSVKPDSKKNRKGKREKKCSESDDTSSSSDSESLSSSSSSESSSSSSSDSDDTSSSSSPSSDSDDASSSSTSSDDCAQIRKSKGRREELKKKNLKKSTSVKMSRTGNCKRSESHPAIKERKKRKRDESCLPDLKDKKKKHVSSSDSESRIKSSDFDIRNKSQSKSNGRSESRAERPSPSKDGVSTLTSQRNKLRRSRSTSRRRTDQISERYRRHRSRSMPRYQKKKQRSRSRDRNSRRRHEDRQLYPKFRQHRAPYQDLDRPN